MFTSAQIYLRLPVLCGTARYKSPVGEGKGISRKGMGGKGERKGREKDRTGFGGEGTGMGWEERRRKGEGGR